MATGTTDSSHRDVALDDDLGRRIRDLTADATSILGRTLPVRDLTRAIPAKQMLRHLWDATVAELLQGVDNRAVPDRLADLTVLLARIREAEAAIDNARVDEGVMMLRRVRRALARLQETATVDDLLTSAAEAACTLGFDRALLSTIKDSTWNLHTMYITGDPVLAREMEAAGRENPRKLDGTLVESDIVTKARPGLVYDVQHNPRVNRDLTKLSGSTSYGVAPLTIRGNVVGLVHGDCYRPHREVDATDRAVLNLFAEGLSHTLARVTVVEGLANLRAGIDNIGSAINITARQPVAPQPLQHPLLSTREVEVIELLAAGESNRLIARKLSISEGTVKTHITHILRKLGAANRAEAVAYWLRDAKTRT
ncbi:LuxR family transcriptional regulator [Skermania sp. ID1734]|uniref:helix-turn-helix transcriptional regulator n=1 Tax=Skermania sp. ID1734 TaxID=2597516 RepID=UPI0011807443|nr:response regulator transcription factor [Skermania sp. ID1734]TSD94099.1 LuxR family transcriptional regulator [Skermania sp. ID1734]